MPSYYPSQCPGVPNCFAPIVEDTEPTSDTLKRTAYMLSLRITLNDIRDILMIDGLSEYQVFLAVKGAEILSGMSATSQLPSDYETCASCGFDHEYEPAEANSWHIENED